MQCCAGQFLSIPTPAASFSFDVLKTSTPAPESEFQQHWIHDRKIVNLNSFFGFKDFRIFIFRYANVSLFQHFTDIYDKLDITFLIFSNKCHFLG